MSIVSAKKDEEALFTYVTAHDKIKLHEFLQARNLERAPRKNVIDESWKA